MENFAMSRRLGDTVETITKATEIITSEPAYITAGADEIVRFGKELSEAEVYNMFSER